MQTLFSSPFFNFQVQERERVVSWWIWLYVVVAVTLTAFIRFVWYISCMRRESTVIKSYEDTSQDAETGLLAWTSGISLYSKRKNGKTGPTSCNVSVVQRSRDTGWPLGDQHGIKEGKYSPSDSSRILIPID